jgi:hypothetical protein
MSHFGLLFGQVFSSLFWTLPAGATVQAIFKEICLDFESVLSCVEWRTYSDGSAAPAS